MDEKHNILQPSGYDEGAVNSYSEVFTDKKPIETTGTTCDAFSARFENLRVFVKQLNPEFLSNPKFREAFRKEYEIGFSLNHSSLPRYIRFLNGDTIVTEYIDGITLHDLIKTYDPWLHQDSNIEKLVAQLLNVMDYLHRKNVIHCDIKTDNIMITNDTRNLMLIDFDKAFTASQDLTSGTPLNFGSEEENLTKRQMDVRGVRNIIENLLQYVDSHSLKERMGKVVAMAGSTEMTIPELLEIWKQHFPKKSDEKTNSKRPNTGWWLGGIILIALLVIIWSYFPKESQQVIQPEDIPEVNNPEMTVTDEEKIAEHSEKSMNNELPHKESLTDGLPRGKESEILNDSRNANVNEREAIDQNSFPTQEEYWAEIRQRTLQRGYKKWEAIITDDIFIIDSLMDSVESEIKKGDLSLNATSELIHKLAKGLETFEKNIGSKYYYLYPELSRDEKNYAIENSEVIRKRRNKEYELSHILDSIRSKHYVKSPR